MAPYENSLWYVETSSHPLLEIAHGHPDMVNYIRPSFWSRFKELQRVMWDTNNGLTARHAYDSRPSTWPVLRRGINYWTKDHRQIYLLGNPFIWYGSLCAIMVYLGARAILMLRAKRGRKDFHDSTIVFYDQTAGFLTLAWAMHYLPFFAMHRQLFLHHYLPALYFSILLLAVLFDALTSALRPRYRTLAAVAMIVIAFVSYATYAPITYATPWTRQACERARLTKTWDLNCNDFPNHVREYTHFGPAIHRHKQPSLLAASAGLAEGSTTGIDLGLVPQAGNHPFEEAPKQAAISNGLVDGVRAPVAQYAEGQAAEPKAEAAAAAPMPAPPPPDHEEKPAVVQHDAKEAAVQQDIRGLDQEAVEAVVLKGTAHREEDHAPIAATHPPVAARAENVASKGA